MTLPPPAHGLAGEGGGDGVGYSHGDKGKYCRRDSSLAIMVEVEESDCETTEDDSELQP